MAAAIVALAACASKPPQSPAATPSSESSSRYGAVDGDFGAYLMTYYRNPDPGEALDRLIHVDFDPDRFSLEWASLVSVFYAHLFRQDPEFARSTLVRLSAMTQNPGDRHNALIVGLALFKSGLFTEGDLSIDVRPTGGTQEARDLLEKRFEFEMFSPEIPHDLDLCWMSFFATGKDEYVWKIADYLRFQDAATLQTSGDGQAVVMNALMSAAAKWALSVNAREHEEVRRALMEYAREHSDTAGTEARKIAAEGLI